MHTHSLDQWTHEHVFLGEKHEHNERRTWFVVALTAIMMIGEIAAGSLFGSMALLADGWHMATHAAALGIAGAAYVHVLADAATSVLAIAALAVAMVSGWVWADPAVGIVGSLVIGSWAFGLIRDSGAVLLDVSFDRKLQATIRARLEAGDDRITDLHLWQVGPGHCAAVISLVSEAPLPPATYKDRLRDLNGLSHIT